MRRREFITVVGAAAVWPISTPAQQAAMPVVGYLYAGVPELSTNLVAAFRKGLSEAGFVEGRNVSIEYRFANNDVARLPELAGDLVRRRVAAIAAPGGTAAALALKSLTTTIPIVFSAGSDPVQIGLVADLNRPGRNLTGVSSMNSEIVAKRLGLLHELLPKAVRFAVLVSPIQSNNSTFSELNAAATTIGRTLEYFTAGTNREIETAFEVIAQKRMDALLVSPTALFDNRRSQLVTLAAYHRVPTMFAFRDHVEAGGLISYGSSAEDRDRQVGIYVGRILKGEKPADLPVMRAVRFELVINLATAKLLGIDVPPGVRAIADEVIE